jgi:predicted GNAT family acetyltransferase
MERIITISIRKLQSSDLERLEQFLSNYVETSMILRRNIKYFGFDHKDKGYYNEYLGTFDPAGSITGVFAHDWNGYIMMQAENESILRALIATFLDTVSRPIVGLIGLDNQVKIVVDALSLSGELYTTNRAEELYALDLHTLSMPTNVNFSRIEMVTSDKVDRAILTCWLKAYDIETLRCEDNKTLNKHVTNHEYLLNGIDCWALLIDGDPVSLSGFSARLPDIVEVGPVWTPPEYRNRGYARALVALTLQAAKEQGVGKSILFSNNPAAAKAYEAIGFEKRGSYRLSLLKNPIDIAVQY